MITDRIEDFLDRFSAAWDAGDAGAFGDLFIDDASLVTWQGQWLRGRNEIARVHDDMFRGEGRGPRMRVQPLNVRALGPAIRLVVTEACDKMQTFTLILRDGRWVCAALHNSAIGCSIA